MWDIIKLKPIRGSRPTFCDFANYRAALRVQNFLFIKYLTKISILHLYHNLLIYDYTNLHNHKKGVIRMKHNILSKRKINIVSVLKMVLYLAIIGYSIQLGLAISNDSISSEPSIGSTNPTHRVSDNPYLQLPYDMKDWPPISPPSDVVSGDVIEDPTAVQIYNVSTGNVTEISSKEMISISETPASNSSEPYKGLLPSIDLETVIPPDDRTQITDTTGYPWRTIVKLYITFPNEKVSGSGAIVGTPGKKGFHVLTAGHCVYDSDYGGWAKSIMVVPALDITYMPYNYAWATYLRSYTGWTSSKNSQHDWGIITLDRNIGDFTGWMGLQTASSSDSIYTGTKNVAGYPGDKDIPYWREMWFDSDNAYKTDEYNHWYYMDTYAGQSGGPVWNYYTSTGNRNILAAHAYGVDSTGTNSGTRLNSNKYDYLVNICNTDTSPVDKADLIDDGDSYSDFSPTTIVPGNSFRAWSDVRNVGTASSGGFYVYYYASIDQSITTSDYLIGSVYVLSISPFSWKDSDWTGSFPSIPTGTYYVGWVIDRTNEVSEFDETNNVACKTSYKLTINSNSAPTTPSIPSGPSSGASGTAYSYSTSANDPDGDMVKYTFDWADGTTSETGHVSSGTAGSASHTWTVPSETTATFNVRARATDSKGKPSTEWSNPTTVSITGSSNVDWKSGRTTPATTNWKAYGSDAIYVNVDTTAAVFTETPHYFVSLGGSANQFSAQGISAIYSPTSTGFRIYLKANGIALTPAYAKSRGWYVQWLGVPKTNAKSGSTPSGTTNWKAYGSNAIYLDVNTVAAGFTSTPRYFASLGGGSSQFNALGVNGIYSATPTGFRIYLRDWKGAALTPAYANSKGWYVQWLGVPADNAKSGSTPSGTTNWKAYGSNAIYLDVNTAAAGFASTPCYFTSLGGRSSQYDSLGINAIYYATSTGFRIYLKNWKGAALTPAYANSKGWHVQWLGV